MRDMGIIHLRNLVKVPWMTSNVPQSIPGTPPTTAVGKIAWASPEVEREIVPLDRKMALHKLHRAAKIGELGDQLYNF